MRILSIDPGFERVGIAILEKTQGKDLLLFSECFRTSPKLPFCERLNLIGSEINIVIKKWKPDCLAIETLLFNNNQKTAMAVAESRGVIVYIATHAGLTFYEYTPLQIKNAVTGYGRATKDQVDTMVRNLIKIEKKDVIDDEIDAIAVGLTCSASVRL